MEYALDASKYSHNAIKNKIDLYKDNSYFNQHDVSFFKRKLH